MSSHQNQVGAVGNPPYERKWSTDKRGIRNEVTKGQLNSECIYEVIVSPKMQTLKSQGFLPYQTNKDRSQKNAYTHQKITKKML